MKASGEVCVPSSSGNKAMTMAYIFPGLFCLLAGLLAVALFLLLNVAFAMAQSGGDGGGGGGGSGGGGGTDVTAPVISDISPSLNAGGNHDIDPSHPFPPGRVDLDWDSPDPTGVIDLDTVVISAKLVDSGTGINAASSQITLEGTVLTNCDRTPAAISCTVTGLNSAHAHLETLYHIQVSVADNASPANVSTATAIFRHRLPLARYAGTAGGDQTQDLNKLRVTVTTTSDWTHLFFPAGQLILNSRNAADPSGCAANHKCVVENLNDPTTGAAEGNISIFGNTRGTTLTVVYDLLVNASAAPPELRITKGLGETTSVQIDDISTGSPITTASFCINCNSAPDNYNQTFTLNNPLGASVASGSAGSTRVLVFYAPWWHEYSNGVNLLMSPAHPEVPAQRDASGNPVTDATGHLIPWVYSTTNGLFNADPGAHSEDVQKAVDTAAARGINGFIASYQGKDASWSTDPTHTQYDYLAFSKLMEAAQNHPGFQVAGFIETAVANSYHKDYDPGLCGADSSGNPISCPVDPAVVKAWIKEILDNWGSSPSYLKKDGKPVIYVYRARLLSPDSWNNDVIQPLIAEGYDAFFMADYMEGDTSVYSVNNYLEKFDGMFTFNPSDRLQGIHYQLSHNAIKTKTYSLMHPGEQRKLWMGTVVPGFDTTWDAGRPDKKSIPRSGGAFYQDIWQNNGAADPDWVMISTWNDYTENTQIEPSTRNTSYTAPWSVPDNDQTYLNLTRSFSETFKGGDVTAPAITINSPPPLTPQASINISATFSDGGSGIDGSTALVLKKDLANTTPGHRGDVLTGCNTTGAGIDCTTTLTPGNWEIRVQVYDRAGNMGSVTKTVSTDQTPPVVYAVQPAGWTTYIGRTITAYYGDSGGSGINAASAMVFLDGSMTPLTGCAKTDTKVTCQTADLTLGPHQVSVSVEDNMGLTGSGSGSFSVDNIPPDVTSGQPSGFINTKNPVISGAYVDTGGSGINAGSAKVFLDGSTTALAGCASSTTGISCPTQNLVEGQHSFNINVTDVAGYTRGQQYYFNIDTTPPVISSMTPSGWMPYTTYTSLEAYFSDAGSGIDTLSSRVFIDGGSALLQCMQGPSVSSCGYQLTVRHHTMTVKVKDMLGNEATATSTFDVDVASPKTHWGVERPSLTNVAGSVALLLDSDANHKWSAGDETVYFGIPNDTPLFGRWSIATGPLGAGPAVFRSSSAAWAVDINGDHKWTPAPAGPDTRPVFGLVGDQAVAGDWDGGGTKKIGVARPNASGSLDWKLDYNGNGAWDGCVTDRCYTFGNATDKPATGDWNGDGKTEIGTMRTQAPGVNVLMWYLDLNGNGDWNGDGNVLGAGHDIIRGPFGLVGDQPAIGKWHEKVAGGVDMGTDPADQIGVFRNGAWYLDRDGNGVWNGSIDSTFAFGMPGDLGFTW